MMMRENLFPNRVRCSTIENRKLTEEFYSDKSRIIFSSSFRRMMQKAQVFSLESNTSVRNRLTHSLEVADVGRTIARGVGRKLEEQGISTSQDTECMQSIVESACLIHDIGNPPFGHFGEEAIKSWFRNKAPELFKKSLHELPLDNAFDTALTDFRKFDGNPQGFRITTRLHSEIDDAGLNLTHSTLLAAIKYPPGRDQNKKLGVFSSEMDLYERVAKECKIQNGRRYFLSYLMELADDICYCLSDIADSFEKRIITSRDFKGEFKKICDAADVDSKEILPVDPIMNFSYQVSIKVSRRIVREATAHFCSELEGYLSGEKPELLDSIPEGTILGCFKTFSRKFIYTSREAQQIEIAGNKIVHGLLDHFGCLLNVPREDFDWFVAKNEMRKGSGMDIEWRIFNQLSGRMVQVYRSRVRTSKQPLDELIERARLIVDHISGMTDNWALKVYQNTIGVNL